MRKQSTKGVFLLPSTVIDWELIGCKLPVTLVRHGGYESVEDMIADLLPKVREKCVDPISDAAHTSASHLRTTSPGGVHAHL